MRKEDVLFGSWCWDRGTELGECISQHPNAQKLPGVLAYDIRSQQPIFTYALEQQTLSRPLEDWCGIGKLKWGDQEARVAAADTRSPEPQNLPPPNPNAY